MSKTRKKLIEVYIPLDGISTMLRIGSDSMRGDPDTPKKWLPRRSHIACSAIMFASMVDDPASCPDEFPTEDEQNEERDRLNDIIYDIANWRDSYEDKSKLIRVQNDIRYEIARSISRLYHEEPPEHDDPHQVLQYLKEKPLPIYDPFVGGKSILLESQRLRFASIAPDINPLGVLINKALVGTPSEFVGHPPINPDAYLSDHIRWHGASGMANDIQYYGKYIRDKALNRIGHLYPKVISDNGTESTVIAWLWVRTMACPTPSCGFHIPLLRHFQISTKKDNRHWVLPHVDQKTKTISFTVQNHDKDIPKQAPLARYGITCLACRTFYKRSYLVQELQNNPTYAQMVAILSERNRKKIFISPTDEHIRIAQSTNLANDTISQQSITPCVISHNTYGVRSWYNMLTERQVMTLNTFGDLLADAKMQMIKDGAEMKYADAITAHLALAISKDTHGCSSYVRWVPKNEQIMGIYGQNARSMICDFTELNPFSDLPQPWMWRIKHVSEMLDRLPQGVDYGLSDKSDASKPVYNPKGRAGFGSNPYYDDISLTDLSDFFYVTMWSILCNVYPGLFAGILVSKPDDMIITPRFKFDGQNPVYRFENLMGGALRQIRDSDNSRFPSSIFYKYDTHGEKHAGRSPGGWETILSALISAGFQIVGTWPMRTDWYRPHNSLHSITWPYTIVLTCIARASDAKVATRQQFVDRLRREMPQAIRHMRDGGIGPSELAQSVIGPGMAVFSRYQKVLDTDNNTIPVREAISIINKTLYDILAEREVDFDDITRRAISWFEQYGFNEVDFRKAKTPSDTNGIDISRLESDILKSGKNKAQLLKPLELSGDWNKGKRFTVWEAVHHLIRIINQYNIDVNKYYKSSYSSPQRIPKLRKKRNDAAAKILSRMLSHVDAVEDLAYRLHDICQRKGRFQDALQYNELANTWPEIIEYAESHYDLPTGPNTRDDL